MADAEQLVRFHEKSRFLAAIDQSGGIQEARARIITSPVFRGERVFGAIVFEGTLSRALDARGVQAASVVEYLWGEKRIIPFLKIDKGLENAEDGVQVMRHPRPRRHSPPGRSAGVLGTKEARNPGLIASFSRALLDGLTAEQSDAEFDATLDASIYRGSVP